jgi:peptidoglycan/LPS O-acetylase OafA/YrhL
MHQRTASTTSSLTEDGESRPRYRADVDGLRAVAILAVVLFHAHAPMFGGGFVGVDIFFVISGFLIGGIVFRDVDRERFSFATFYARRAKRILPALIAMSLAVTAIAVVLLRPDELADFAKADAAALVGSANIRFWALEHYFHSDWQTNPLVMTWSLGVEEQFYLFLPPLMLLVHRLAPRSMALVILGLSLLSFALSVHWTKSAPNAAFYLLPGRAWELGVGVLVALWQERTRNRMRRPVAQILSLIATLAMLAPIVLFDEHTRFPGFAAMLPVLGTAVLIATEPSTINRAVLASPPMRFIGLISYSWYLWHWPLMVFAAIALGQPLSPAMTAWVVALSFVVGVASWRFVEMPFRQPTTMPNSRLLRRYGAALLLGLGIEGVCLTAAVFN